MNRDHCGIIVVGGGLGGLAAAIALFQREMSVQVFEKSAELREVGAGLNVWPNATRVLGELGLLDEVVAASQVIERLHLRTWRGELISEVRAPGKFETPTVCIHRRDLLSILAAKVPQDCIQLGQKFECFEQGDTGVIARFEHGQRAEGEALIGADGIYSRVRAQSLGESKPAHRGYQAWRAVADYALPTNLCAISTEYWGHGKRFGVQSLGRGRTFWYATSNAAEGTLGKSSYWKEEAREIFAGWAGVIPGVIEATPAMSILKHEIVDRPPERGWGTGRVTLLGDAAHPTTPNLGQGACMAIEDALVLACCLSDTVSNVPGRLRRYESLRYPRSAFITRESRRIGLIGQLENPLAVAVRTAAIKLAPRLLGEMRHRAYFAIEG